MCTFGAGLRFAASSMPLMLRARLHSQTPRKRAAHAPCCFRAEENASGGGLGQGTLLSCHPEQVVAMGHFTLQPQHSVN